MAGVKNHRFKDLRRVIKDTPEYQLENILKQVGINGEDYDLFKERYILHKTVEEVSEKHYFTPQAYNYRMNRILLKIRKSLIDINLDTETN